MTRDAAPAPVAALHPELAAGEHPVLRGAHLVAMLAGEGAGVAADALADAVAGARDIDDVRAAVDALDDDVDLVVLHVAGTFARGILRGKRLAVKADRVDGAVVLYGAPPRPRATVFTETDCATIEVLDVAAGREAPLAPFAGRRATASRLVVRRVPALEAAPDVEAASAPPEPVLAAEESPELPLDAPARATLSFADGASVDVAATVVLGRSPRVGRTEGLRLPRTIALPAADRAVSRSHVRIVVDGELLTIEDLDSRNGTAVVDAEGSRTLVAGETVPLTDGMVVTIAEHLAFRVAAR